jgi:hypothetical protein
LHYVAVYGSLSIIRRLHSVDLSLLDHDAREKKNRTPTDVFKCAVNNHGEWTHPDWRIPSPEEFEAFEDLIRRVRDTQVSLRVEPFRRAIASLEKNNGEGALETLRPLFHDMWCRGKFDDAESLRLIRLDIRQKKHTDAIQSLHKWVSNLEETRSIPPLQVSSWIDEFKVHNGRERR